MSAESESSSNVMAEAMNGDGATPLVSVITSISHDHEKFLGNTLSEIAGEKAGIIKPGCPVVSAPQEDEVQAVLDRVAARCVGKPMIIDSHREEIGPDDPGAGPDLPKGVFVPEYPPDAGEEMADVAVGVESNKVCPEHPFEDLPPPGEMPEYLK